MQISQIRLSKFKLFENISIDIKPLTLLTGPNSSGKSSVLNAVAAVKQTESPSVFPFEFVPNGKNVTLGTYKDIVNKYNTSNSFGVGFCVDHNKTHYCLNSNYRYSQRGDHILLESLLYRSGNNEISVKWEGYKKGYICNTNVEKPFDAKSKKAYLTLVDAIEQFVLTEAKKKNKDSDTSKLKVNLRKLGFAGGKATYSIAGRTLSKDLLDKIGLNPTGKLISQDLSKFVSYFQNHIAYIAPIRALPLRYYSPDQPHTSIDPKGINCVHLLYDWFNHDQSKFKEVNNLLHKLELSDNIKSETDSDEILKMLIKPFGQKMTANLADVGFGISQALPFIVADVSMPNDSIILINQPEVHLHPNAQAQLANYFVDRLSKRQYLIETHSEYLINRLRLLVQKELVDPDKIGILFFPRKGDSSTKSSIFNIKINKDGSLTGAPEDFFKTYFSDSFNLAMGVK